ncbi:RNA chaperone Hfq, partial [Staphylococcus pseudintermedius]
MIEKRNIQDEYLEKFKNEGKELTVFLTNGFQLRGTIVDFDQYVIDILS